MQLEFDFDWGSEPWSGRTPRSLTKVGLRDVEKSRTLTEPATVAEIFTDPAQLLCWVSSSFKKEVSGG